jgi:hypothetical protein
MKHHSVDKGSEAQRADRLFPLRSYGLPNTSLILTPYGKREIEELSQAQGKEIVEEKPLKANFPKRNSLVPVPEAEQRKVMEVIDCKSHLKKSTNTVTDRRGLPKITPKFVPDGHTGRGQSKLKKLIYGAERSRDKDRSFVLRKKHDENHQSEIIQALAKIDKKHTSYFKGGYVSGKIREREELRREQEEKRFETEQRAIKENMKASGAEVSRLYEEKEKSVKRKEGVLREFHQDRFVNKYWKAVRCVDHKKTKIGTSLFDINHPANVSALL